MLHQGMIISGVPYSINDLNQTKSGGTPYGPSHVENVNSSSELTKHEFEIARKSGMRLADLISRMND